MIAIDSSSLILMAKIDILDKLIKHLQKKPVITSQVYDESTSKIDTYDAKIIRKLVEEKKIAKKEIKNPEFYKNIQNDFNLGGGEAESIVFCMENRAGLITDDKKAMNACRILNIKYATVPNLLITLYKKGLIPKIETSLYLKKLKKFGRYSKEIIEKIEDELK